MYITCTKQDSSHSGNVEGEYCLLTFNMVFINLKP